MIAVAGMGVTTSPEGDLGSVQNELGQIAPISPIHRIVALVHLGGAHIVWHMMAYDDTLLILMMLKLVAEVLQRLTMPTCGVSRTKLGVSCLIIPDPAIVTHHRGE